MLHGKIYHKTFIHRSGDDLGTDIGAEQKVDQLFGTGPVAAVGRNHVIAAPQR